MKMIASGVRGIIFAAAVLGVCIPAHASTPILIWPVDPVIEPDRAAGALWLENQGSAPAVMQVRVFRWTQVNGEDRYEEQLDVEASPPMARIQPGARQLIRLTSDRTARLPGESAYRVIVDEIPVRDAAAEGSSLSDGEASASPSVGVRFQMRYSIPLFVYAPLADGTKLDRKSAPQLVCTLSGEQEQKRVQITNSGKTSVRLVDAAFDVAGQQVFLGKGLVGYALPGSTISRPLPEGATGLEPLTTTTAAGGRTRISGCAN